MRRSSLKDKDLRVSKYFWRSKSKKSFISNRKLKVSSNKECSRSKRAWGCFRKSKSSSRSWSRRKRRGKRKKEGSKQSSWLNQTRSLLKILSPIPPWSKPSRRCYWTLSKRSRNWKRKTNKCRRSSRSLHRCPKCLLTRSLSVMWWTSLRLKTSISLIWTMRWRRIHHCLHPSKSTSNS